MIDHDSLSIIALLVLVVEVHNELGKIRDFHVGGVLGPDETVAVHLSLHVAGVPLVADVAHIL